MSNRQVQPNANSATNIHVGDGRCADQQNLIETTEGREDFYDIRRYRPGVDETRHYTKAERLPTPPGPARSSGCRVPPAHGSVVFAHRDVSWGNALKSQRTLMPRTGRPTLPRVGRSCCPGPAAVSGPLVVELSFGRV
jgi:hypothetical protein